MRRPDMPAAAVELAARMRKLLPSLSDREPTSRTRDTWRYGRKGSLAVVVSGPRRGRWFDHEAGVGGDALALVAHLRGCSMREAWEWALAWLETAPAFRPARRAHGGADGSNGRHGTAQATTVGLARRVWGDAVQPVGTLVEAYLRGRGLALPGGAPVRFHPACPRGAERLPAMLCLMSDPVTGEPCGVHRTFLTRDGSGKAPEGPNGERPKMMAGRSGVVRLVPDQEVGTGLGIAEGNREGARHHAAQRLAPCLGPRRRRRDPNLPRVARDREPDGFRRHGRPGNRGRARLLPAMVRRRAGGDVACASRWRLGRCVAAARAGGVIDGASCPEAILDAAGGQQEHFTPASAVPAAAGGDLVTEDMAALRFVEQHRDDLRFCHHAGAWYQWIGSHWQREETGLAFSWARRQARELGRASGSGRAATQAGKAAFSAGVERFCQSDRAFAVTSAAWDQDPWLLATPGGTVDLRTGELRPARREDHITRCTAVEPAATTECPTWLAFLDQATKGDAEFVGFVQRWFGYCLTGITREHALLFLYGPGGNGKGVLLNTVRGVLSTHAVVAAMDTFTVSQGDKHSTDLAMLRGARLVIATETEEGRAWAEARVKALTGGDPVTARFMRRDNFTFDPVFKLTISGNHRPALRNVDDAARRRFMIAPLVHRPGTVNRTLADDLRPEWPTILRWMVEGCLAWRRDGLRPPQAVLAATADYFEEQDHFGRWLAERCILGAQLNSRPAQLLADFQAWCERNGEPKPAGRRLRPLLENTDCLRYVTINGAQFVRGIGLRPPEAYDGDRCWVEGGGG